MKHKRKPASLLRRTSLSAVMLLASAAITFAQSETEPSPGPNWVFNGQGQTTDRPAIVDATQNTTLIPINVNHHWGHMNQLGQVVVFPRFDWTDYSFEGLARVVVNGKTGFIVTDPDDDTNPRAYSIPPQFEYADRFSNGLAIVRDGERWGMIDKRGKVVVPLEFDGILRFQDGFAAVQRDGLCGFINRAGKLTIPLRFKRVRSFHNGFAAVQLPDGRWGYLDKRGKMVWTDPTRRVLELGDFHQQYAKAKVALRDGVERWGYLSKSFRFRVDPAYEDARDFHNGIAAVKQDGKWGFIRANGRWMIEPQFDAADDFDDAVGVNDFDDTQRKQDRRPGDPPMTAGLYAMVKLDGRWGYVNRGANGGLVPQFKSAEPFLRGMARVDRDKSFAYVTETGEVRFDPRVAIQLGFVVQTSAEQGRVAVGGGQREEPGNRIVPAPPHRDPAKVPYGSEHEYEETLPVRRD